MVPKRGSKIKLWRELGELGGFPRLGSPQRGRGSRPGLLESVPHQLDDRLRSRLSGDSYEVEASPPVCQSGVAAQIGVGQLEELPLLFPVDSLDRRKEVFSAPGLDLYEDQHLAVQGNRIDLTQPAGPAALQDAVVAPAELANGQLLSPEAELIFVKS